MRSGFSRGAISLAVLLAAGSAWTAEKATRIETARWAAGLNGRSTAGREWLQRNRSAIEKLITPVLDRCVPENGEELTAFSIFLRLSRQGRIREVLTDVEKSLDACMTSGSRGLQLPEVPRDDYWIQVNLAASL